MIISQVLKKHPLLSKIIQNIGDILFSLIRIIYRRNILWKNIFIIVLHKLGDTIYTIPTIKLILNNYNDSLTILCYPESIPLYQIAFSNYSNIEYCTITKDDLIWEGRLIKYNTKRKLFKSRKVNDIFDLTGNILSASILFNCKASKIIGINDLYFRKIYDVFTPVRKVPHLMDIYLDAIESLYKIDDSLSLKKFEQKIESTAPILIQPFAGWKAKEWSLRKYFKLADSISLYHKTKIVIPPNSISDDILIEMKSNSVEIVVTNTIEELISVISGCSVLISNDSGPIQIANILGKATFTIYGSTNPKHHIPFSEIHSYIQKEIKCSPSKEEKYCFTDAGRIGCSSYECMNQLSENEVFDKVFTFLCDLKIVNINSLIFNKN